MHRHFPKDFQTHLHLVVPIAATYFTYVHTCICRRCIAHPNSCLSPSSFHAILGQKNLNFISDGMMCYMQQQNQQQSSQSKRDTQTNLQAKSKLKIAQVACHHRHRHRHHRHRHRKRSNASVSAANNDASG